MIEIFSEKYFSSKKFSIEKKVDKISKIFRTFSEISKFSFFKLIFRRKVFRKKKLPKKFFGNFFFRNTFLRKINLKNENFEISGKVREFFKIVKNIERFFKWSQILSKRYFFLPRPYYTSEWFGDHPTCTDCFETIQNIPLAQKMYVACLPCSS